MKKSLFLLLVVLLVASFGFGMLATTSKAGEELYLCRLFCDGKLEVECCKYVGGHFEAVSESNFASGWLVCNYTGILCK